MMKTMKVNGKFVPISGYKQINGQKVPVIKAETEEIKHSDGRVDIIIKVPFMELNSKQEEI